MKRVGLLLLCLGWVTVASAQPVVIIVRHAEKASGDTKDPDLSDAGQNRAAALSRMLADAHINAIFTSEFKRTQETAGPTAALLRITPTIVPGKDIAVLVAKIRVLSGNALVVGHSDTIPQLLKALGIDTPVTISDNDYTDLFIVLPGDKPQLLRIHYPS